MAGDIENKAGTAAPDPKQNYITDEQSSGANTPPEKELTEQEIEALKARVINENEEKKSELKEEKGPTIPGASLWMRSDNEWLDQIATQPSIYDDPRLGKYFAPHPKYENLHRFDPSERWTWREEMVHYYAMDLQPLSACLHANRKSSTVSISRSRSGHALPSSVSIWAVVTCNKPTVTVSCQSSFPLCSTTVQRPRSPLLTQISTNVGFLPDLGMDTDDYNLGNTIFQISFLCAEIPSQMISKKIGPDRWIPFISCAWSIVCGSQFFLTGRSSFFATRALIGMLQGGFIPDVVLYLTYFFKASELPFRLSLFWAVRRITDIIAPILAFGILRMRGLHGREGWRWMFLVEGCIMLSIGTWSWFMMVASPTQTKKWYRKNGWFTEREEKILVNRVIRDDPTKGDMHNRQAITLKALWKSFCDFDLWPSKCKWEYLHDS